MGFWDGLVGAVAGPLIGGLFDTGGDVYSTNKQNQMSEAMQAKAHAFEHAEAGLARDWQEDQFAKAMKYNTAQAVRQRGFERTMRKTQYQAAVKDMKRAGLNPMLAYSQGGAGTPQGATASISAPGGAAKGSAHTYPVRGYRMEGMQNAMQMATMAANIKNIDAQTQKTEADKLRVEQDTRVGVATAAEIYQKIRNLKEEIPKIRQDIQESKGREHLTYAHGTEAYAKTDLARAQEMLTDAERLLKSGKTSLIPAEKRILEAQAIINEVAAHGASNLGKHQSNWFFEYVAPYLPDFLKSATGAAAIRGMAR